MIDKFGTRLIGEVFQCNIPHNEVLNFSGFADVDGVDGHFVFAAVYTVNGQGLVMCIFLQPDKGENIVFIVFHISLYGVCKFFGLMILVSRGRFDIIVDKLVNLKKLVSAGDQVMIEEASDHKIRPKIYLYKHIVPRPKQYFYKLFFEKNNEYDLPEGKLYNWSKIHSMNDWQIFRSAEVNDEFYLITRKNKVLYVYNTKHFEVQEQL